MDSEDAARLLAFALARTRASDPTHRELLRRLRADAGFQGQVEAIARGLGLRVLGQHDHGLVLAADGDSPFAFRVADYRQGLTVEDRLVHGVVHVAIAAWCYPTAAALEDEERGVVRVTVAEIVSWLRAACVELQRRSAADPDLARPELQEAWRLILARPDTKETPDNRRASTPLHGIVGWALDRLTEEGLFKREEDSFLARPAYRIQVRELAAHEAYRLLRSLAEVR